MTNPAKKGSRATTTREGSPRSSEVTDADHPPRKRARRSSGSVSGSSAGGPPPRPRDEAVASSSPARNNSDMTEVRDASECSPTVSTKPQESHRIAGEISDSRDDDSCRGEIRMSPPPESCSASPHHPQSVPMVTIRDDHDEEEEEEEEKERKTKTPCCSSVEDGDGHVVGKWMSNQKSKNTARKSSILRELDWRWNEEETSEACVHVVGDSGAQVFFHQDYSCGTAAARGTLPMSQGQHFWEIKMDSPVYGTAMMVGIGTKQIDLTQYSHTFCNMLGSDTTSESCGLSYTGWFYQGGGPGKAYCSKYGQGTVIGVHLDMWSGTLTYYKNGKCLGVAAKGLLGKAWHPMISSTAARSSMCLQVARSFPSSLQFWCCRTLRRAVPAERGVLEVLDFPPGMRAFLEDNLLWLLDSHSRGEVDVVTKSTQTDLSMATHQLSDVPLRKRPKTPDAGEDDESTPPR